MRRFFCAAVLAVSAFSLGSCSGDVPPPDTSGQASPPQNKPKAAAETKTNGNSHLNVTLSCQIGNLPGQDVRVMPINAFVAVKDKGYVEEAMAALGSDTQDTPFLQGETGEDGRISFTFNEDREYHVVVMPMDERFETQAFNISNFSYKRVMIKRGETVQKNFVLAQAYCDKDGAIRGIASSNFSVPGPAYTADYEKTGVPFGIDKQYYWRSSFNGSIQHLFGSLLDTVSKKGFSLTNGRKTSRLVTCKQKPAFNMPARRQVIP